jgi:hypothetical protein
LTTHFYPGNISHLKHFTEARHMQPASQSPHYMAFLDGKRIAQGTDAQLAAFIAAQPPEQLSPLVFDANTGEQIDLSDPSAFSGANSATNVNTGSAARPGRPKLGVVAREVTLLPQHWDWLAQQPGGASVTLRKLVHNARRFSEGADRVRQAQVACYRFINAIAGNERGFEEATRALFTCNAERFAQHSETWPTDVRAEARRLAEAAFAADAQKTESTGAKA